MGPGGIPAQGPAGGHGDRAGSPRYRSGSPEPAWDAGLGILPLESSRTGNLCPRPLSRSRVAQRVRVAADPV